MTETVRPDPWSEPATWSPPEWGTATASHGGADLDQPATVWPEGTPDAAVQPRRWVWDAMEPTERVERLSELASWVTWLRATYELHNDIPICWYRHRALVERLSALYAGWARTYSAPSPGRDHAELEWIATLDAMVPRLKRAACAGGHQKTPLRKRDQKAETEDFKEFLKAEWPATAPVVHPAEAEAAHLNPPL